MNVNELLSVLRDERQQLEDAILGLEKYKQWQVSARLDQSPGGMIQTKKRGRPLGSKNKIKMVPLAM